MPGFFSNLLQVLRGRRGRDMRFMCRHRLSERGEASQTALAQEIINTYTAMDSPQRRQFFEMLCTEFSPDPAAIHRAAAEYHRKPDAQALAVLSASVEPPRQELIRRINTAPRGIETLVALREHLLELSSGAVDVRSVPVMQNNPARKSNRGLLPFFFLSRSFRFSSGRFAPALRSSLCWRYWSSR
jgi:hypothetical protein